jgi:exosortase
MTIAGPAPPARDLSSVPAAAAGVAAAALYAPVLSGIVRQWYEDPNAAYGALVAIAAAAAAWQRWPRARAMPIRGSAWGSAALIAAAAMYAAATLAADLFLVRASFVAFAAATLWFVFGTAHLRRFAAPLALALAAIPLPSALITQATLPLQLAASHLAAATLATLGLDVVRDGNVLTLSYITLEVAEACSGMRSVVTLLALVGVYWGIGGPRFGRVLLLAAAVVPVALAGNSLRVVATALLAAPLGEGAARGFVHEATGFAAFAVMCTAMVGVHVVTARAPRLPALPRFAMRSRA